MPGKELETQPNSRLPRVITVEDDHGVLRVGTRVLPLRLAKQIVAQEIRVLWDLKGLYGLVPPGLLANALEAYRSLAEARQAHPWFIDSGLAAAVSWGSTVPVPSQVAAMLKGDSRAQQEMLFRQEPSSSEEGQQTGQQPASLTETESQGHSDQ